MMCPSITLISLISFKTFMTIYSAQLIELFSHYIQNCQMSDMANQMILQLQKKITLPLAVRVLS